MAAPTNSPFLFPFRSYIGSFLDAVHAARAFDRVAIILRGWSTQLNFQVAEYRAESLMRRCVDLGARFSGQPRTLLLPGISMADFIDEVRAFREGAPDAGLSAPHVAVVESAAAMAGGEGDKAPPAEPDAAGPGAALAPDGGGGSPPHDDAETLVSYGGFDFEEMNEAG